MERNYRIFVSLCLLIISAYSTGKFLVGYITSVRNPWEEGKEKLLTIIDCADVVQIQAIRYERSATDLGIVSYQMGMFYCPRTNTFYKLEQLGEEQISLSVEDFIGPNFIGSIILCISIGVLGVFVWPQRTRKGRMP
jgi:hypothetical protein